MTAATKTKAELKAERDEQAFEVSKMPPGERAARKQAFRAKQRGEVAPTPLNQAEPEAQEPAQKAAQTPSKQYIPHGAITWVMCDVPGYEAIEVGYDLGARWRVLDGSTKVKDDDHKGVFRKLRALCPGFRNHGLLDPLTEDLIVVPDSQDLDSYIALGSTLQAIAGWVWNEGLQKAVDANLGNSPRASSAPSSLSESKS